MVILCGGRGTRLQQSSAAIPKPMVEIGGQPILWHAIQIYLSQGFDRFLLLTGYLGDQIERFVGQEPWPAGTEIRCLQTGIDTPTGGRLHLAAAELTLSTDEMKTLDDVSAIAPEYPAWMFGMQGSNRVPKPFVKA